MFSFLINFKHTLFFIIRIEFNAMYGRRRYLEIEIFLMILMASDFRLFDRIVDSFSV